MSKLTSSAYLEFINSLKGKIKQAQTRAMVTVNTELILLYWEIGNELSKRSKEAAWGAKILQKISVDLKKAFPEMKGFSYRNLKYMRQFAQAYPNLQIGQAPLAQISWYHNIALLTKVSDEKERLWYAREAIEYGWSRNVMVHQIELDLYNRKGKAISNFENTLPQAQSDLANSLLKDPYIFNFLNIDEKSRERELENSLVDHILHFLVELGAGFAFVGKQYHIQVGDKDFYIDLLFYHLKLRCYVAIDLKTGEFKSEYAGKMNFYLSALDDIVKHPQDKPSIGLILCKDKNKIIAEYALRDNGKPIGVSEYQLNKAIPKEFKSNLPSIEEIEQELGKNIATHNKNKVF